MYADWTGALAREHINDLRRDADRHHRARQARAARPARAAHRGEQSDRRRSRIMAAVRPSRTETCTAAPAAC
jgi:hypothetical protein